jgi:glycerophosphoryl diester phosphodiesterase
MDSGTPFPSPQDFLIIAHRGASSYAPENIVAAFDLALQMRTSHLELDVHLTRDDHLVIIHDDTMSRTQ